MKTFVILIYLFTYSLANATEVEIFKSGMANTPMNLWDPFIHEDQKGTHLFFGTLFCRDKNRYTLFYSPGSCEINASIFAIGYGFKARGENDFRFRSSPVLDPGTQGQWDDNYVETPSLVQVEGNYFLFYSAWNKKAWKRYQIGVATFESDSLDQLLFSDQQFSKTFSAPLITHTFSGSDFDRDNTQEPSAVWNEDKKRIEVYYIGIRANQKNSAFPLSPEAPLDEKFADIKEIGFGRKCFNIKLRPLDCKNHATLSTRFDDLSRLDFINMPEVKINNGQYWLFYSDLSSAGSDNNFPYGYKRTAYRTSFDGLNWSVPTIIHETLNRGVHSPTVTFGPSGFSVFAQSWWFTNADEPKDCFKNNFSLPYFKECHNTSLVILMH